MNNVPLTKEEEATIRVALLYYQIQILKKEKQQHLCLEGQQIRALLNKFYNLP